MCEQIALALGAIGASVGLAANDRLLIAGIELKGVKRTGAKGVRTILNNPAVEIAVAEVTAQGIVDEGLGFDYCDAVVLLSTSGPNRCHPLLEIEKAGHSCSAGYRLANGVY